MAILVEKRGESGNIFFVLGSALKEMRTRGIDGKKSDEMFKRVSNSKSYEKALGIIGEYVKLIIVE